MVIKNHPDLSAARQCALLGLSRSGLCCRPSGESRVNLSLMRQIDEAFMECPFYGSRQMARHLQRLRHSVAFLSVIVVA